MNTVTCRRNKFVLFVLLSAPFLNGMESGSSILRKNMPGKSFFQTVGSFLGRSVAGLGKLTFRGLYHGGHFAIKSSSGFTKTMVRNPKIVAGAAVLSSIYGASKSLVNRARLYENMESTGICKMPGLWSWFAWALPKSKSIKKSNTDKIKIYNWRLREVGFAVNKKAYPTARSIISTDEIDQVFQSVNKVDVARAERDKGFYQQSLMKQLYEDSGFIVKVGTVSSNPRKQMLDTIDAGLNEMRSKLTELSSYTCFPSKEYDKLGIEKIINDCCKEYVLQMPHCPDNDVDVLCAAADMRKAFDTNQLSCDQEQELDELVKRSIKTRWVHWATFRPNFGLAATMYWEVLKRIKRLQALQGIANKYYGLGKK